VPTKLPSIVKVLAPFLLPLIISAAFATTYYVDSQLGRDSDNGLIANPVESHCQSSQRERSGRNLHRPRHGHFFSKNDIQGGGQGRRTDGIHFGGNCSIHA
jgi:hypothetical protein